MKLNYEDNCTKNKIVQNMPLSTVISSLFCSQLRKP